MPAAPLFALTRCHACCMFSLLTTSSTVVIRVGCFSTTRPYAAHPGRTPHRHEAYVIPVLLSAFWPSSPARMRETTMPSADFYAHPACFHAGRYRVRHEILTGSCFP